jgi:MFS family permease
MNRDLILMAISMFLWGLGETSFLSFQPLYLQQLGADPINIGVIMGAYGLAATLAHIPAGYLADRIGRKPLMLAAWIIGVVATWIMALANGLTPFIIGMTLYGATLFVLAPLNSYITVARGKWSVGRAITLISASFNLGGIIGPLIGGALGERAGFRNIFLASAFIFIISTLIILFIRPQPVDKPAPSENGKSLLSNTNYVIFLFVYFLAAFAMYLPQPLAPNFLQNQRGLNLLQIGQLYSIGGIGIVVLNLTLGQLEARRGFLIGQVTVGIFALMLWQGTSLPWYAGAYFLLGGFRTARSLATAQIRSLIHQAKMGLAYGLAETSSALATILAPLLAGYLYARNPAGMFTTSLGIIAVSVLVGSSFPIVQRAIKPKPISV